MSKKYLIVFFILITAIISCKQKERIIRQNYGEKITGEEIEKIVFSENEELHTIKLGKANFSLDINGEKFQSGGTIAIIKDSVIIVSLIPLMGYEISRMFCYKDTIVVLDRLEKIFFYTSIKRNINKYSISGDYSDIESILTGRAFVYNDINGDSRLKKNIQKNDNYINIYYEILENEISKIIQEIRIRGDNLLAEHNNISDNKNKIEINIEYNQFQDVDNLVFPHEIRMIVNNPQNKLDIKIEIGNISLNEKINADLVIPVKYKEAIIDF